MENNKLKKLGYNDKIKYFINKYSLNKAIEILYDVIEIMDEHECNSGWKDYFDIHKYLKMIKIIEDNKSKEVELSNEYLYGYLYNYDECIKDKINKDNKILVKDLMKCVDIEDYGIIYALLDNSNLL